ncbi:hypothetical protein LP420_08180 [Massilia sp. B-10]|nr:hypothetical protein LP420_08180 [Massilia sp. B-10]
MWQPKEQHFASYRHLTGDPHGMADNQVSALYRDRVGTLWIGTWYAGVSRVDLNSGGFARIVRQSDRADTLSDNKVRAIVDGGPGKLWLGTNEGLNHFDIETGSVRFYKLGDTTTMPAPRWRANATARCGSAATAG